MKLCFEQPWKLKNHATLIKQNIMPKKQFN